MIIEPPKPVEAIVREKKRLRSELWERRKQITPEERKRVSEICIAKALERPQVQKAKIVLLYASQDDEIQLYDLMQKLLDMGKIVCLPFITGKMRMEAVRVTSLDALVDGEYGIKTVRPEDRQVIPVEGLDVIFVPGTGFSPFGARLGHGGGFYDRYLDKAVNAFRLVLAYDWQIVDEIPVEAHDTLVDEILTEKREISCRRVHK